MNARQRAMFVNTITLLCLLAEVVLSAEPLTLTVNLRGFRSDKGAVEVALFDQAPAFPKDPEKAVARQRVSIVGGSATVAFRNLGPGTYAVSAYHDVNGNGRMDTNFIGIPKEPTGASNDAKGRMGPPSFKDAQFTVKAEMSITVTMQ
ncbi:hypothetical protein TBR22_A00440 [Luteitalea sp. TBR-22]|uniref:DUF2141 domain-containing protein n=1 Tax=Luteitalea sp. TBR-22 TaxID=2802971 RepID=UPI001AF66266|nr:DUF2141 domain-containing protein [Luteitalea sp. TBR-22]BCS30844.1 hypothetical protein TBR22_A00440 [Luteitalea sp. TBR-22]